MKKTSIGLAVLFSILTAGFPATAQKNIKAAPAIKDEGARIRIEKSATKFAKVEAFSDGQGVWLEWQMAQEANNLGFTVRRSNVKNGSGETVNRGLISGAYLEVGETNSAGRKYSYFDATGNSGSSYSIETLNLNGARGSSKRISVRAVGDLTAVAGASSGAMRAAAASANLTPASEEMNLPIDLKAEVAQNATQADAARQLWVAAQAGVKIGVRSDGFYRVTRAQLETAGFNASGSTANWQLYVNGVEQSINVAANGGYIEFYGRAVDTSEADTQIYYLVAGETAGKRIGTTYRRQIGGRILSNSYAQSVTKKERFVYTSNVLNGDTENFFGSVIGNGGATVSFPLSGIDFSSATTGVDLTIQGLTTTAHQTKILLNGHELGTISFESRNSSKAHYDIPTEYLVEGTNNLQMTALGAGDITLFDTIKFDFLRKYQADGNAVTFYTPNYRAVYVDNFSTANVRVFDITYGDGISQIGNLSVEQNNGKYRVYLPSNRGRVMLAVEDSAILSPATVTANVPSTLTTTNHNADLVIVTYKNWAAQANDWAAYRRAQGFGVEVVNIEDIYDEHNFGATSSLAVRSFLQYAYTNWQTAPKYVLLIGDATYDIKNYFGGGYNSFIPTRLVDTVYTESGSDDALADFNDDGLTEIAIGRIPAKNAAYVTQQLGKVTAFEQSLAQNGLEQRGALFASDVPNGYDFASLSDRVRQQLPQSVTSVAVNLTESDAQSHLLSEMNSGRFIVNYSGHGTTADWSDPNSGFFNKSIAAQLSNNNLSIFTMLTCLNGFFINPNQSASGDGLAETLLTAQKGAVATWASTGLTTPDVQEIMATRFYQQLGAGNFTRLGDLIKDAKTEISYGRDVRLSWVLLGDPTLKVR